MLQPDDKAEGLEFADDAELELLATDAFRAFGANPEGWPDRIIIDRNGTSDLNLRGIWRYDRPDQYRNVEFRSLDAGDSSSMAYSPDSSGESA